MYYAYTKLSLCADAPVKMTDSMFIAQPNLLTTELSSQKLSFSRTL